MWAVSRVNKPVLLQVRQLSERLGTNLAHERAFACMSSQVNLDSQPNILKVGICHALPISLFCRTSYAYISQTLDLKRFTILEL